MVCWFIILRGKLWSGGSFSISLSSHHLPWMYDWLFSNFEAKNAYSPCLFWGAELHIHHVEVWEQWREIDSHGPNVNMHNSPKGCGHGWHCADWQGSHNMHASKPPSRNQPLKYYNLFSQLPVFLFFWEKSCFSCSWWSKLLKLQENIQ